MKPYRRDPKLPPYVKERRDRGLYAVLEVPKDLRKAMRRDRFIKSLATEDRKLAAPRAMAWVTEWRKLIAAARHEPPPEDDAAYWRKALRMAKTPKEREMLEWQIDDKAWEIGDHTDPKAADFYFRATGRITPFAEHLDDWLKTSSFARKTVAIYRTDVLRFTQVFPTTQDVTKQGVRQWVMALMQEDGLKAGTVRRIMASVRGYWRYLQSLEVVSDDADPLAKLEVARHSKRQPAHKRKPYEPKQVRLLLAAAQADGPLWAAIAVGMYSGARLEEICSLKVADVSLRDGSFKVLASKTSAGVRTVPVHSALKPILAKLMRESKDGHVIGGLNANKYGYRGPQIGKRFSAMKTAMGYGADLNFHSLRRTVAHQLEEAGIPEGVCMDILGHDKTDHMSYGRYSGTVSLAVKREAIERLSYGNTVTVRR